MRDTFTKKLYHREIDSAAAGSRSTRQLYGQRRLIDELDIVNELNGHTGCVNALSWSKSGQLLASGSDDQHLNIHKYQPDDSTSQFRLATTVATGHTANIFSVKFMPHSNDRTVITAAGDSEVRVFDLEYAGAAREASNASTIASEGRRSRRSDIYNGVRNLSDGNTDCRVYRSHADRVKRIVTESSPHLFLTCSEDGEVRQWDLRQPSAAYPSPRGGRFGASSDHSIPPPLISYKRYQLDLNTISCSASQPHYIALGGAHLHAFLHDRRMTGRDRLREAGKPLSPSSRMSAEEEELMQQATQCVRKFAPTGRKKMGRTENGHITACKISDARPNEMIVSWSGEHIYSFDLVHSPDASERDTVGPLRGGNGVTSKHSKDKKRKRQANSSQTSLSQTAARPSSRPRTEEGGEDDQDVALRIRYQNGQSEDIPITDDAESEPRRILTHKEREAQRIAKATVDIRSSLFESQGEQRDASARFTAALGQAASILPDINDLVRGWRYPLEPSVHMVAVQQTLRRNRESTRRFVQAAGTLSRVLGGKLQTLSGTSPAMSLFSSVENEVHPVEHEESTSAAAKALFASVEARSNDLQSSQEEQFGYDFIKAILLWLESGIGKLIEGFTRPPEMLPTVKAAQRLPIPEAEASTEAIDEYLIPYLLRMASDKPVVNVETNRFEVDENRQLFASEKAAVMAFAQTVKIPFADLSSAVILAEGEDSIQAQNRETAVKYWASKVARGILLNAAEGVNFACVTRAFGGVRTVVLDEESNTFIDPTAEEGRHHMSVEDVGDEAANNDDDEDMRDDSDDEDRHSSDSDPDEEDGVPDTGMPRFMYASAYERRRMRDKVGLSVPCSSSTRCYRGHCNVRTVKDVNYFGLDDEYVVSGSDDGHFFIWDRKTTELVNVLEGDGETVNVIQGHPYETMLAVSGIDHTIKIFSPDARARQVARLGEEVQAADPSAFSSLAWPSRFGRRRMHRREDSQTTTSEPAMPAANVVDPDEDDYVAPTGLKSRKKMSDQYRITSQNDSERQGGNQDAFLTVRDLHPLLLIMSRRFW